MTLLITQFTKYGIVQVSDSALSNKDHTYAGPGKKIYNIPHLSSMIAAAGSYLIEDMRLCHWMPKFINEQSQYKMQTLEEFAHNLKDKLNDYIKVRPNYDLEYIFHLSGYQAEGEFFHPEFWFIRNRELINSKNDYQKLEHVRAEEQLWNSFKNNPDFFSELNYEGFIFLNGKIEGRAIFHALHNQINTLFDQIWKNQEWKFRPPNALEEYDRYLKLKMQIIVDLFSASNYPGPLIGGLLNSTTIKAPNNCVPFSVSN